MYRGLHVIILKDSCGTYMIVGDLYIISATWQIYTKNRSMPRFGILICFCFYSLYVMHFVR